MRRLVPPLLAAGWIVASGVWIGIWLRPSPPPPGGIPQALAQATHDGVTVACAEVRLPERQIVLTLDTPVPLTPEQVSQLRQASEVRVTQADWTALAEVVAVIPVPPLRQTMFVIARVDGELTDDVPVDLSVTLPGGGTFTLKVIP